MKRQGGELGNPVLGSVYRHLERQWVQEFFQTGSLRLTTLAYCRAHDVASRIDRQDGRIGFSICDDEQMIAGVSVAGAQSYMLCASSSCSSELQDRFGTDSWIEILDPACFALAVADAIGCSRNHLLGPCRYVDAKEVNSVTSSPLSDCTAALYEATRSPGADIEAEFDKANAKISALVERHVGDDVYFMKDQDYEVEQEFRFVWPVDRPVCGPEVISCPKARQFCKAGF